MAGCRGVTDAAFMHLHGIHPRDMSYCNQPAITDAAFAQLRGIHTLVIEGCDQDAITGAAFSSPNFFALCMFGCSGVATATAQSLGLPVLVQEGRWFGGLKYANGIVGVLA
jgi:hypothetical protein